MSVAWVVLAQGICGVAKDLTKTASKSAIKLTAGDASGQLFKWVAFFTGSKNAMKGVGFFLGGAAAAGAGLPGRAVDRWPRCWRWCCVGVVGFVPPLMGKSKASKSAKELFAKNRGINLLAAARVALFGARDVWFVVGVPVFLYAVGLDLHDGRRLPGAVDHRLRRGAGAGAGDRAAQRRRPEHRGAGRAPVVGAAGAGADRRWPCWWR